ncbi:MAG: hypothetical protein V4689_08905 [Verrucomicrobiota bacterium]
MISSSSNFRSTALICLLATLPLTVASAQDGAARIVFQNGRSVPVSAVAVQGNQIVVNAAADGFNQGQTFPLESADHVYGVKPVEVNRGTALVLTGKPGDALKLLEPVVAQHKMTAKIPGNFWMEAARATLVAYALNGDTAKCAELGKEISDATPQQGIDPFVSLGKALMLPASTKAADRETAFRDLTTDNLPTAVCAYASLFRANVLKEAKKDAEALEAYLMVPCLFPSGGMILNATAELNAAEHLTTLGRREEAVALLQSSVRESSGTLVAAEANKRLESLK